MKDFCVLTLWRCSVAFYVRIEDFGSKELFVMDGPPPPHNEICYTRIRTYFVRKDTFAR